MVDPAPTLAPESAAPVAADSQPAAPGPDVSGLSPEVTQALQEAYGNVTTDAPPASSEPAATPAAPAVPAAAQEPESEGEGEPETAVAEAPGEPKLSRAQREAARRQAEVDQAVASALAARDAQRLAEAQLADRNEADQQVMQRAAELMGSAEEENRLIDEVANGNFDAADELKALRKQKDDHAVMMAATQKMVWANEYDKIQTARKIRGVEPAFMDSITSIEQIFPHIEAVVTKRVEAEAQAKLERTIADYESRLGRAASQLPTTETGGRAVGASSMPTLAEVQTMYRTGNWQAFAGREAEIMAAYQSGRLK